MAAHRSAVRDNTALWFLELLLVDSPTTGATDIVDNDAGQPHYLRTGVEYQPRTRTCTKPGPACTVANGEYNGRSSLPAGAIVGTATGPGVMTADRTLDNRPLAALSNLIPDTH